jgi:hypothetical protein
MEKKYALKSIFMNSISSNSSFYLTILTFFLFGLSVHGQTTSDRFPLSKTSVNATTEKDKQVYQETNTVFQTEQHNKIISLDQAIRAGFISENYSENISNQYNAKLTSICSKCIIDEKLDSRATFVFIMNNPTEADNLLNFLEEFYTNH